MVVVDFDYLSKIRKGYQDKKVVFSCGVFDLTHVGHVLFLEECKKLGDILVVGVSKDETVRKDKGDERPIINDDQRLKIVDSLKSVDYTLFFEDPSLLNQEPYKGNTLAFLEDTLEALRPDIYAANNDISSTNYRRSICEARNISFRIFDMSYSKEFGEVSTSKIINKIKGLEDA